MNERPKAVFAFDFYAPGPWVKVTLDHANRRVAIGDAPGPDTPSPYAEKITDIQSTLPQYAKGD